MKYKVRSRRSNDFDFGHVGGEALVQDFLTFDRRGSYSNVGIEEQVRRLGYLIGEICDKAEIDLSSLIGGYYLSQEYVVDDSPDES